MLPVRGLGAKLEGLNHHKKINMDFEQIAHTLTQKGYVIIDNFFADWKMLRQEADEIFAQNDFRPAHIGQGNTQQHDATQRGDNIYWLDNNNLSDAQKMFFEKIDTLQGFLNQTFFWGTNDIEMHFAIYDNGAFYQKHLDNFKGKNTRRLSFILYLNENWQPKDGGELRIFLAENTKKNPQNVSFENSYIDIAPIGGRLACFVSEEMWHEVRPTHNIRCSLTGWIRRAKT